MKQLLFMTSSIILLAMVSCREEDEFIYAASNPPLNMTGVSRRDSNSLRDDKKGDETKHKDRQQFKTVTNQPQDSLISLGRLLTLNYEEL